MDTIRVAVNGFGRIGRAFFRAACLHKNIEIVALNDLHTPEKLRYLLQYDTVYGTYQKDVERKNDTLLIDGKSIPVLANDEPAKLPWKEKKVDVVIESTGVFTTYAKAKEHLKAGAKKVIVTAPLKDEPTKDVRGGTVLIGINEQLATTCDIISNASCTTNAISIPLKILEEAFGVESALLNTVHAYTASQSLVDEPSTKNNNLRISRAGAQNIIPSTTGAADATARALPAFAGRFDGIALRVPTAIGSLADLTCVLKKNVTSEIINDTLKKAVADKRYQNLFQVTEEELVSSDITGLPYVAIADLKTTRVAGGKLIKILLWYDNEAGYAQSLVTHVLNMKNN